MAKLEEDIKAAQILAEQATNAAPAAAESVAAAAAVVPATPAKLILTDRNVTRSGTGYLLTLYFRASNNSPVGAVDLIAEHTAFGTEPRRY